MSKRMQILTFASAVIVGTAVVILLAHWISDSWAVGAGAGVIAGVLSVVMYPVVFRARS